MSDYRFSILSLTIIANAANVLATMHVPWYREYWSGVATAATITSYLYQALTPLIVMRRKAVCGKACGYAKRAIEVSE
jgi:hypothetical protein